MKFILVVVWKFLCHRLMLHLNFVFNFVSQSSYNVFLSIISVILTISRSFIV